MEINHSWITVTTGGNDEHPVPHVRWTCEEKYLLIECADNAGQLYIPRQHVEAFFQLVQSAVSELHTAAETLVAVD